VAVRGEVRALLLPVAALENIAEAIHKQGSDPVVSRWVGTERACAALAREIEAMPVTLGLTASPEQWPLSSAASN
jgi:hypothetical protein